MGRRRRRSAASGEKKSWGKRAALAGAGLLVVGAFGGYIGLRSYLHSEAFRSFLSAQVGKSIEAKSEFAPFHWNGLSVSTDRFTASDGPVMRNAEARGLRTEISLNKVSQGLWLIPEAYVQQIEVELDVRGKEPVKDAPPPKEVVEQVVQTKPKRGWLPTEVELSKLNVARSKVTMHHNAGDLIFDGMSWDVVADGGPKSFRIKARDGELRHPFQPMGTLFLNDADLRVKPDRIYIQEMSGRMFSTGTINLSGEIGLAEREFDMEGTAKSLRCDEILPEDWKQRLRGKVDADFHAHGSKGEARISANVEIRDGVLTALPLLDTLAAYADTERFRLLNLSEAKFSFRQERGRRSYSDIVIASEGLVRVEGRIDEVDKQLDGTFRVGIVPGVLAHIPGAEEKVFLPGERGLLWTTVRITGTWENPKEDLSDRMVLAAGMRMIEVLPETGEKVLKFSKKLISDPKTGEVIKGVTEEVQKGLEQLQDGKVLDKAADAVEKAGDLLDIFGREKKK